MTEQEKTPKGWNILDVLPNELRECLEMRFREAEHFEHKYPGFWKESVRFFAFYETYSRAIALQSINRDVDEAETEIRAAFEKGIQDARDEIANDPYWNDVPF